MRKWIDIALVVFGLFIMFGTAGLGDNPTLPPVPFWKEALVLAIGLLIFAYGGIRLVTINYGYRRRYLRD